MKIIREGNRSVARWWHGKTATCAECNMAAELEPGDECHTHWRSADARMVAFYCPACGTTVRLINPSRPPATTDQP